MKHIKTFNLFTESQGIMDEIRGDDALYDHTNDPVLKLQIKAQVEDLIRNDNTRKKICNEMGIEMPKEVEGAEFDDMFDKLIDKAIEYFTKHPHRLPKTDNIEVDNQPKGQKLSDDRGYVPRTNNIGQQ
jgi:hypothetical protein